MKKLILPVLVLAVLAGIGFLILENPPESSRGGPPPARAIAVEVMTVQPSAYQISLESYGTIAPRTQSALVAQVGGQILSINENLREGGFFSRGDILLEIDPREFLADVQISQAALADAQQNVEEEQARGAQAARDWERLGNSGEPSALVLRGPQLAAAQARLASAEASLSKAQLDLERTTLRAPYDGRVLEQRADIGQVVNAGTAVADVYATDLVEVRLPLRNTDLRFFDLPEGALDPKNMPDVEIYSDLGQRTTWYGKVVRTEGAIDPTARQLHVVAQIDNPFSTDDGRRPLKIGEYVTASLSGRQLVDARIVPVQTVYQNSFVYIAEEGVLMRRPIDLLWQNDTDALVAQGIEFGDQLVITPLGQVSSGMPVKITQGNTASLPPKTGPQKGQPLKKPPMRNKTRGGASGAGQ